MKQHTQNTTFLFSRKNGKVSMSDIDENSSDNLEVFSDANSLSYNDNEAWGLYFNETGYMEQELRQNMTKFNTREIRNTKRDFPLPIPHVFT